MKMLNLLAPALIAGAVRYPCEGLFEVDDTTADRLIAIGQAELAELDLPEPSNTPARISGKSVKED